MNSYETAIALTQLGYTVHTLCPLKPHKHRGKECEDNGKVPYMKGWTKPGDNENRVKRVSAERGVGILTGNGLLVVDADVSDEKDGVEAFENLFYARDEEPPAPMVRTGGGGLHWYFMTPKGVKTPTNTKGDIGVGIDTRGDGGQAVAPPSPHISGNQYTWTRGLPPKITELDIAPLWLIDLINSKGENKKDREFLFGARDEDAEGKISQWLVRLEHADGKTNHDPLLSAATCAYGYVKAERADEEKVTNALIESYRKSGGDKDEPERDRVLKDAYDYAKPTIQKKKSAYQKKIERIKEEAAAEGKEAHFLQQDPNGLREAFRLLGYEYRYNNRIHKPEIKIDGSDWKKLSDLVEGKIRGEMMIEFKHPGNPDSPQSSPGPYWFAGEKWKSVTFALWYETEVDPFKDWLEALPEWDREARIDSLLDECFDLHDGQDEQLVAWASRAPLIGAVERTYNPGSELHQMPVLIGEQNVGKGSFTKSLVPPEFREWGHVEFAYNRDEKKNIENTLGAVIVEWNELSGVLNNEKSKVKAWLTRNTDHARLAYRHNADDIPRRFIVIATANFDSDGVLQEDTSGQRRYGVVHVGGDPRTNHEHVRRYIDGNLEQLWAEAVWRYKFGGVMGEGETARMPDDLLYVANEAAQRVAYKDETTEDRVRKALISVDKYAKEGRRYFRVSDILKRISLDEDLDEDQGRAGRARVPLPTQKAVGTALSHMKAEKMVGSIDGIRANWWTVEDDQIPTRNAAMNEVAEILEQKNA